MKLFEYWTEYLKTIVSSVLAELETFREYIAMEKEAHMSGQVSALAEDLIASKKILSLPHSKDIFILGFAGHLFLH